EKPWSAGLIDAEIAATIPLTTDHAPGRAGDRDQLIGEIFRKVSRAIRFCAQVFVASGLPLRSVRDDVPHAARHLGEIDLGDRHCLVTDDSDIDLTARDEALNQHFVPALEHCFDSGGESTHAPDNRSLLDTDGGIL